MTASADFDEATFNYDAVAELFPARNRKATRQSVSYKRFGRAADAIRFAIEELPPELLLGTYLEVDEMRFDRDGIRRLYRHDRYPLSRNATGA